MPPLLILLIAASVGHDKVDLYSDVSYQLSKKLTSRYSTSFSLSSRLFPHPVRQHIYAIYGLVRIADEIVDTYEGQEQEVILESLENETYSAITRGYSANPIIHSFALTARLFDISKDLIAPFFASMRMDLKPTLYTSNLYANYIHGSAEVIGLMCLKVFCQGNKKQYQELASGASKLGSAYQKVNFLRDLAADYTILGRTYFPGITYEDMSSTDKDAIVADIRADFISAKRAIEKLPNSSRAAVAASFAYYYELLEKLDHASVEEIKNNRIRVSPTRKLLLLLSTSIKEKVIRS